MRVSGADEADYLYRGRSFSHLERSQNSAILPDTQNASSVEIPLGLLVNTEDTSYTLLHKKILKARSFRSNIKAYLREMRPVLVLVRIQAHRRLHLSRHQTFFLPSARGNRAHYSQNLRLLFGFRGS